MGQFDALKDDMDDDSNIMVTHDILKSPVRNRDGLSLIIGLEWATVGQGDRDMGGKGRVITIRRSLLLFVH